jgi:hypothetical protein
MQVFAMAAVVEHTCEIACGWPPNNSYTCSVVGQIQVSGCTASQGFDKRDKKSMRL